MTDRLRDYGVQWRKTRGRYLKYHPTCEEPGCKKPAIDVHHLDGLGPTGPLGHKWSNLMALCRAHHSRRTARESPAGWNAQPSRRREPEPHPGVIGTKGG